MDGKIMVIGGTGLVGNALLRAWTARGAEVAAATYHSHPSGGFLQLDMRDSARVGALLKAHRPSVVAVPAANPFVDYCELHPEETRKVNVEGTLNVARACRELGARMIFYSSDYVFDGLKGSYTEEDAPCPINEYGRQKAEAERGVLACDPRNLILRTSGAYGWQWEPKNFVLQVRNNLSEGHPMRVANVRYNPTYVENLAEITAELVSAGASGIFHTVGAEEIARDEFARRVARAFGLRDSLIQTVPAGEFKSPTPRPKQSSLRTQKVQRILPDTPPVGVDAGLKAMLTMEPAWRDYARTLPDPAAKLKP
ncbi:MAG: SDR family oxidoreductase [Elusimicrobiota bacterium]|nr:SDR family oxidoreductase [Elusimicrobiota bacterium]